MRKMLDIISRVPSFSDLPESHLEEIKNIAVERHYNKGEIIFSDGDEGDGFFVVVEGLVKIFKVSLEGKEQILHIYGPGEPFGRLPFMREGLTLQAHRPLQKAMSCFFPGQHLLTL